jgi:hypothetical protein
MKTIRTCLKSISTSSVVLLAVMLLTSFTEVGPMERKEPNPKKNQSIMIALLLDTSNSMDGLIDQAKSQLWKIVNELAAAKCDDGSRPDIKIALYEYGNDNLPSSEGYIRQVSGLTDDLDVISEKLFALRTNGGSEFCGNVIRTSLNQLAWSTSDADLKMIFIAGNEEFTQGPVSYHAACGSAKEKGVIVNTIYCGQFEEGLRTNWKDGANIAGGTYMSIEQDRRTVYVETPYDKRIDECNNRLNNTYIYYGSSGASKKAAQATQDSNAASYGQSNSAERTVSKSSHAYKNSSWDLVDAAKDDEKVVIDTKEEYLPKEMKGMSPDARSAYVRKKADERKKIQAEIQELSKQRQDYIASHTTKEQQASMLDASMMKAVKEKAKTKNLSWQK